MKDKFFLLLGLTIIIWSFYAFLQKPAPAHLQLQKAEPVLLVGDESIEVELAETNEERARGLSGRESLERGHGMLFLFENTGLHGFWMKDMLFSIDIVWIDEDWQVVGVERVVAPETFPQVFRPEIPIKYVLELNSGETEILGIDIGSQVYLEE